MSANPLTGDRSPVDTHWSDLMRRTPGVFTSPAIIRRDVEMGIRKMSAMLSNASITDVRITAFSTPANNAYRPLIFRAVRPGSFDIYCEGFSEAGAVVTTLIENPSTTPPITADGNWTEAARIAWDRWLRIEEGMHTAAARWGFR